MIRANGLHALACNDGFDQLIGLPIVDFYLVLNERPLIFDHELILRLAILCPWLISK